MTTEETTTIYPERDSTDWARAWAALEASGRDIDAGWMLMSGEAAAVPGGVRWAFKNHALCEPSMASDPAYNGRTKYVYLPSVHAVEAYDRANADYRGESLGDLMGGLA